MHQTLLSTVALWILFPCCKEGATTSLVLHSTLALDKASYHHHVYH